jgi:hypothetical protein
MAKVKCPCGRRLRANEFAAGWTVQCPACGGPVTFPEPRKLGVARQVCAHRRVPVTIPPSQAEAVPPPRLKRLAAALSASLAALVGGLPVSGVGSQG